MKLSSLGRISRLSAVKYCVNERSGVVVLFVFCLSDVIRGNLLTSELKMSNSEN